MPPGPAHPDPDFPPGGEGRLLPPDPGWPEDEGYLAALYEEDDPGDPELDQDPDNAPPPGLDDAELAALVAEDAAGPDDRYAGASEDELIGAICAWDRVEASAARKHAAVVKLPGTRAAFLSGIVTLRKVALIARAAEALDPAEARAAEALVLDRAGRLTPGGLRAAIGRAAMQVAPGKAKRRREQAARLARVERWAEDSGNGALAGRELPPAAVLAADQRVTASAKELKRAGWTGTWISCGLAPTSTSCSAPTPDPTATTPAPPPVPAARTARTRRGRMRGGRADRGHQNRSSRAAGRRPAGRWPGRCRPGSPARST
ncbi:MAG TPA: hypothetical protein VIY52_24120 [Streptosporangiaceae bacterium]